MESGWEHWFLFGHILEELSAWRKKQSAKSYNYKKSIGWRRSRDSDRGQIVVKIWLLRVYDIFVTQENSFEPIWAFWNP